VWGGRAETCIRNSSKSVVRKGVFATFCRLKTEKEKRYTISGGATKIFRQKGEKKRGEKKERGSTLEVNRYDREERKGGAVLPSTQ